MGFKDKFSPILGILNSPFKIALAVSSVALVVSLVLEWLLTGIFTLTTILIAFPLAFMLTFHISAQYVKYQAILHQKNLQLEQLTKEFEQANQAISAQNRELNAFAHTLAHELKTPLGIIIGYSEMLGREEIYRSPDRIQEITSQITSTSLKMNTIIQEILLLASLQQNNLQLTTLDMDYIVQEALQRMDHMIREKNASVTLPDSLPSAWGYSPWVEEVWINYLSNAIKYGGSSPHIEIGASDQPDNLVHFWVKDFGLGLTEAQQLRAFEQFTRFSTSNSEGHGLGLSISKRIITKLGGTVGVESTPQNGSTFFFTLPKTEK